MVLRAWELTKLRGLSHYSRSLRMINFIGSERKVYSQNGEDGVIDAIFQMIGTTNKYFVEFGVGGGGECNTRLLRENGWNGLWMDGEPGDSGLVKKEHITADNINHILDKYEVPHAFDLLSIDIDGQDYWVWKAIERSPRVVVIEYNGYLPVDSKLTVKKNNDFVWAHNDYYGAGLEAMRLLGIDKWYTLAYVDFNLVNMFFISNECLGDQVFDFRRTIRTDFIEHGTGEWIECGTKST